MVKPSTPPGAKAADAAEPCNDIIEDVLRVCLAMAPGFTEALVRQIDAKVRQDWACETVYIAEATGKSRRSRNDVILKEYKSGEQVAFLSRRHGLSERRILQIIKGK